MMRTRKILLTCLVVLSFVFLNTPKCFAPPIGDIDWDFMADIKGNFDDGDGDALYWIDPDGSGSLEPYWIDPDGPSGDPPFKIFGANGNNEGDFHTRNYGSPRNGFRVKCDMTTDGEGLVSLCDMITNGGGWTLSFHGDSSSGWNLSAKLASTRDLDTDGVYEIGESAVVIPSTPVLNNPQQFYVFGGVYASVSGGPNDSVYFAVTADEEGTVVLAEFDYMPTPAVEPALDNLNAVGLYAETVPVFIGGNPPLYETISFDEIYTSVLPDPFEEDTLIDRSIFLFDVWAPADANDFHLIINGINMGDLDMTGIYNGTYDLAEIYEDSAGVHIDWELPFGLTPAGTTELFGLTFLDDIEFTDCEMWWTRNGNPVASVIDVWQDWVVTGGQPYDIIRSREIGPIWIDRQVGVAPQPMDIVALEAVNDPPVVVLPGEQITEVDPGEDLTFSFIDYPGYGSSMVFYDVYDNAAGSGTPLISFRNAAVIDLENLCKEDDYKYPVNIYPTPGTLNSPIPDDFFGPGSDPFDEPIYFGPEDVLPGAPKPVTTPGGGFRWNEDVILWDPPAAMDWELLKLKMKSSEPVKVENNNSNGSNFPAESFFDVYVDIDLPDGAPLPVGQVTMSRNPSGQGEAEIDYDAVPITITFIPQGVNDDIVVPVIINADADINGTLNWTRGSCSPCCDEPFCFEPGGELNIDFTVTDSNGGVNINGLTGTIIQAVGSCVEGDLDGDSDVDLNDFAKFAENWLVGT